jgi:two-component system phosphate regulon sensor histidine kinase PhoR
MLRRSLRLRILILFVALIVLSMSGLALYINSYLRTTYLQTLENNLSASARLTADLVSGLLDKHAPDKEIQIQALRYSKQLDARVTIILPDGRVVADSEFDPQKMENHLGRVEVDQALAGKVYSQIRYSNTLLYDTLYVAAPIYLNQEVIGAARVAVTISEIESRLKVIRQTIMVVMAITTILAVILAIVISNLTFRPLRRLTETVMKLGADDQIDYTRFRKGDEISRLDEAFQHLTVQLQGKIDQLVTERTRLEAVLAHMTDSVLIVDNEGNVQLINSAAVALFQISAENSIGKSLVEVVRHHQLVDLWHHCRQSNEQQTLTLETSPDRLFIQAIATPLKLVIPGHILLVFQDLTRLRKLESVRRDFVSNVSHELRTPLAALKAMNETLLDGTFEDPLAARKFLLLSEHEIDTLNQLVQELLELSRIESGRVPLELHSIHPKDLIIPAVERMAHQAERAGLTLKSEWLAELPEIRVDSGRLGQVLINLLHNAIKFTPPGGEIIASVSQEPGEVIFKVRDTGVGIADGDQPRIFERFFKADRARSGGGTGLGLSIARHLVEAHGGRIWVESSINQGSTFFFSIPVE